MRAVNTLSALEEIYGVNPSKPSTVKVTSYLTSGYRKLLEAAPFAALATVGRNGLDCSPRGDQQQVVYVADEVTLHIPDRRGNNRIDSLRNIVQDPRVGLMFLIPGSNNVLRVSGRARITDDPGLLECYKLEGQPPRTVIIVEINQVYFQCARALIRSQLWSPEHQKRSEGLPRAEALLQEIDESLEGIDYDLK